MLHHTQNREEYQLLIINIMASKNKIKLKVSLQVRDSF